MFRNHAELENRTLSNFIETATMRYIEELERIDEFEMMEIINNPSLVQRMKKGSKDAQVNNGRFV